LKEDWKEFKKCKDEINKERQRFLEKTARLKEMSLNKKEAAVLATSSNQP